MRKILILLLIVLGSPCMLNHRSDADQLDPKKVFEEGWLGYRGNSTLIEKETISMAIIKVNDPRKNWYGLEEVKNLFKGQWDKPDRVITIKEMTRYLKYDPGLNDRAYVLFTSALERNAQFVVMRYPPGKADDMWMYDPVLTGDRKDRRIATTQLEDPFMGSDLDYEEALDRLMGEVGQNIDQFNFSFAKGEIINGRRCFVIEVRPDPSKKPNTTYDIRRFFREEKNPVFVRVEYFRNGQLVKIQNNSGISYLKGPQGLLWRISLLEMYKPMKKTTTVLFWSDRKIGLDEKNYREVPFGIFTPDYFKRHAR